MDYVNQQWMVNGTIMARKYLHPLWDNISRDECLIYILYLWKKEKQPAICATLVHFDEKFKKVQKLQLFFNNNRLYKC